MDLLLEIGVGTRGLADRLYRQLATAMAERRLEPGDALPPSRELAAQLGISRSTVTLVYERLVAEGYCDARAGSGTFVAERPTRPEVRVRRAADPHEDPRPPVAYDFRLGVPDSTLFPLPAWRRCVARELDGIPTTGARYADPVGPELLRTGIAHHLGLARSVVADPEDVVLTAGAQQAIDLLARVVLRPGDLVAVEEPGYPPIRQAFAAHGARVVSMPVDGEGADPSALPAGTRLIYVTPSHQFPMGVVMSRARRLQLLEWGTRHDALIVEDDYDSEYRYLDRPLEPLHVLDGAGIVAYVGTFSKSLLPALRIGYVIPPRHLVGPLRQARLLADWHGDAMTQGALGRLLDTGEFAAHVRRSRRSYRARHRALTDGLGAPEFARLRVLPSRAGLHLCAELPDAPPGTARRIQAAAAVAGVALEPLERYCADEPREGLVLGFGAIPAEQIPDALHVLASVLRRVP